MSEQARALVGGRPIGIIGTGLVGAGWAIVFARAGLPVRLYDAQPDAAAAARSLIEKQLQDLHAYGLIDDIQAILARCTVVDTLADAVTGAAYVQESVLEQVGVKRQLMQALEGLVDTSTVIGSSTSGIPASAFTSGSTIAAQVLIAHPVNPPYLVPVVELVPSPATSAAALAFTDALMQAVGQSVVHVRKEIDGFVLNRLQAALLREAWALVEDGVASCEDIDKTVRDGLGLRWSFMGPFETIDLNAPQGVADYAHRFGRLFQSICDSRTHAAPWSGELIANVEAQRRTCLAQDQLTERRAWRDQQLMAIAAARLNHTHTQ